MQGDIFFGQLYKKAPHHAAQHEDLAYATEFSSALTACSGCGAVFCDGKWQWMAISSKETPLTRCPACARVYEKNPAGSLLLQGDFALDHRHEILSLIHAIEANEKQDDPLKRIMWIDYQEQGIVVTAASAPLIAAIGEALHDTYGGELDGHTSESAAFLLLRWKS